MPTVKLIVSTTKKLAPLASEALFHAGAQGLEERPGRGATLIAYAEDRASLTAIWKRAEHALRAVLAGSAMPSARLEVDSAESWRTAWAEHLRPVLLTRRLLLAPTTAPVPSLTRSQRLLVYAPALAFGDGDHATTRLASRAIEAHYRREPGGALLDIGAGTGVLSLVALASGAQRALGTDIDAQALAAATVNAKLNGFARRARFVGSDARLSGKFDLTVINIELRPLLHVLSELPAAARRSPRLLVTGFLDTQLDAVVQATSAAGFAPGRKSREGEWLLLDARRRS